MAKFLTKTKNKLEIKKKTRVYFTCHPDDFETYFETICKDIHKTHDCAIYYTADMSERIEEADREAELGRNNLFVVPVTLKLLTTENRAMDEDIPYAMAHHIPILPIVMESGIREFYARPDRFGELQSLSPFRTDPTEISYEEKLRKHLDSVLISDELAEKIRQAFDAYIFLSYRKKDRRYANELMRMIHSVPECRDIAIWFDEFLTPGRSFKKSIETMMDRCRLFTLLVTPRVLEKVIDKNGKEKDNFVLSTELPLARKKKKEKGTEIFAVEMEQTDKDALLAIQIEDCVTPNDESFRLRLTKAALEFATEKNNTPEHDFLIGLAYLEGIDVERDYERAIELITSAAERGLREAMERLWMIHLNDSTLNYPAAIHWAKRALAYRIQSDGEEFEDTLEAEFQLAHTYAVAGLYKEAASLHEKTYEKRRKVLGEGHASTLRSLEFLAYAHCRLDHYGEALALFETLYALRKDTLGEEHPETVLSLYSIGYAYTLLGKFREALPYQKKAYEKALETYGENESITLIFLDNLAETYGKSGNTYEALQLRKKAYEAFCKTFGETHTDSLIALDNLADAYGEYGNRKREFRLRKEAYEAFCRKLGEEHPETLIALNNLARSYSYQEDYREAIKLHEKAYEAFCEILGERHSSALMALNGLACAYSRSGECEKALTLQEEEYRLRCEVLGETNKETLSTLNNLACTLIRLGKFEKALALHRKVHKTRIDALGPDHPEVRESEREIRNAEELVELKRKSKALKRKK